MALHRVPKKQLDEDLFAVTDDIVRIDGLTKNTAFLEAHLDDSTHNGYDHSADESKFDPSTSPLTQGDLQLAVAEFANKEIAEPVREVSAGTVSTDYYQISAVNNAYVGVTGGEDPNSMFALYDVTGNELDVTVDDVTSDQAGTTSVIGDTWHSNPYLQLSAAPGAQILVKYGTETKLAALPINAFLKEGVISAEVDADIIAAIADIKGTAWDTPVPDDSDLNSLDTRMDAVELTAHSHKFNITPTGSINGVNKVFTLPGVDEYATGTLKVYVNGIKLKDSIVQKDSATQFTINVENEQIPDSSEGDYLEIDYILG